MSKIKPLLILVHMTEISYRIYYILLTLILTFMISFLCLEEIFYFLAFPIINLNPIELQHFIYTNITELFFTYIKSSMVLSIFLSIPVGYIHLWAFLVPGLYEFERKYLSYLMLSSLVMLAIGFLIGYQILIPLTWKFFLELEWSSPLLLIKLEPKISEYFNIITKTIFFFMISFQLPIIFFSLINLNFISFKTLIYNRHYAILYALIIGALLSPPDVFSQMLIAIPTWIFYEIIIFMIIFKNHINNLSSH